MYTLTPKIEPAYIRHCANSSKTESEISPVGGTMNPAVASATPAISIAMAEYIWISVRVSLVISIRDLNYGGKGSEWGEIYKRHEFWQNCLLV